MSGNILVTCATGHLGKSTIDFLIEKKAPLRKITGMSRDLENPIALSLIEKGITMKKGDYNDPSSLTKAMVGIQTLMFISSGTVEQRFEQHAHVLKAAEHCGHIKHIIYTSILKCSPNSKYILTPGHLKTEEALKRTGITYTIFRNAFYMEMLEHMLLDAFTTGKWSYPGGTKKVNFVARDDIAEGLANVLLNLEEHKNKIYEIASGKSYTFVEIAPIISKATGETIVYNPINYETFVYELRGLGLSEFDIQLFVSVAEAIEDGQLNINGCDGPLIKILGHSTKTMEEYLPIVFLPQLK